MKSILKNSLLMLAVAAATVCSTATAQVLINDISEAPVAAELGQVNAIIDMATGELIVANRRRYTSVWDCSERRLEFLRQRRNPPWPDRD